MSEDVVATKDMISHHHVISTDSGVHEGCTSTHVRRGRIWARPISADDAAREAEPLFTSGRRIQMMTEALNAPGSAPYKTEHYTRRELSVWESWYVRIWYACDTGPMVKVERRSCSNCSAWFSDKNNLCVLCAAHQTDHLQPSQCEVRGKKWLQRIQNAPHHLVHATVHMLQTLLPTTAELVKNACRHVC